MSRFLKLHYTSQNFLNCFLQMFNTCSKKFITYNDSSISILQYLRPFPVVLSVPVQLHMVQLVLLDLLSQSENGDVWPCHHKM